VVGLYRARHHPSISTPRLLPLASVFSVNHPVEEDKVPQVLVRWLR